MKKVINKYRNSNMNNTQYSLNYKFDSISSAGKVSGTALELIKKYNELAKEAHSNGNYTEMENFRQYAEHYRKIVTDINEKKNSFKTSQEAPKDTKTDVDTQANEPVEEQAQTNIDEKNIPEKKNKKTLKIVEIVKKSEENPEPSEVAAKEEEHVVKKRTIRRTKKVNPEE